MSGLGWEPESNEAEKQPVIFEYASPISPLRPRRIIKFETQMMALATAAALYTLFASASLEIDWILIAAISYWAGLAIACILHHREEKRSGNASARKDISNLIWRPYVIGIAILSWSFMIQYGQCPHQYTWAFGPYIHTTVTDPNGPCHNSYHLCPILFRFLSDH